MIRGTAHKQMKKLGDLIDAVREAEERDNWLEQCRRRPPEGFKPAQEPPKGMEAYLASLSQLERHAVAYNEGYAKGWADAMYKNISEKA